AQRRGLNRLERFEQLELARRVKGRMSVIIVILLQGVVTQLTHMDVGNAGSVWNMNRPCAATSVPFAV
ncbi:MAG: hypothetical protein ABFR65_10470, partial [Pseudomonadota bacterium]